MLAERRASMLKPVVGNFFVNAAHLAPKPANKFVADQLGDNTLETAKAEVAGLSAADARRVEAMRKAKDGDQAYALGNGLPEEIRLYTAGAVDFQAAKSILCADYYSPNVFDCRVDKDEMESVRKSFRQAIARFEAVLALPGAERRARSTWAAYSLGRTYLLSGKEGAAADAERYLALTRALADEGYPDPLHLAAASLGEQARVYFNSGEVARAVELYAQQAAMGGRSAGVSLSLTAQRLFKEPALLRKQIAAPTVQRLLIAYLEAYGEDGIDGIEGLPSNPNITEAPASERPAKRASHYKLLIGALEEAGVTNPPDADRLAAIAYVAGDFERAKKFSESTDSARALWIRAKLAVRAGDGKNAARFFAQAIHKTEADDKSIEAGTLPRLHSERSVLTLAQGDYRMAFEQLYGEANHYWMDVAYLAERVLTADELKKFVDAHAPPQLPAKTEGDGVMRVVLPEEGGEWPATSPAAQLRELLARRLMREGRYEEAFGYFHASDDHRFGDVDSRQSAKDFAAHLKSAQSAWTEIGKAQALYEAAAIARRHGMEIFGYELGPDYFVVGGNLELATPDPSAKDMAGKDEIARFEATRPPADKRFHYRYRAVELAVEASEHLPKRSEAYAAVLCHAASWTGWRDPDEAAKVYRRYLKNGALVEWGASFGQSCPEPGFLGARLFGTQREARRIKGMAMRHKAVALTALGGLSVGLLGLGMGLRRRLRAGKAAANAAKADGAAQ